MKKDILCLCCVFFCSIGAMAQTKTITGVVSDAAGEPIIGASVVEVGTTNGTITDIDGKFVLNMNPDGKIRVSYIGYQVQTIDLKGKTSFRIQMKEDSEMLEEVVVTGYGGKQLRTKVTNSISKVKRRNIEAGIVFKSRSGIIRRLLQVCPLARLPVIRAVHRRWSFVEVLTLMVLALL